MNSPHRVAVSILMLAVVTVSASAPALAAETSPRIRENPVLRVEVRSSS